MSQATQERAITFVARIAPRTRPGMTLEQERRASRIERLIRRETNDKVRELRVEVLEAEITLFGRCGTYYTKQLAQHAAMSLVDGQRLANHIEVW
jgi:hypothetical protein